MISFIVSAIFLILIAIFFIVPTLLKKNQSFSDEYDELNVEIAKDRLKEIKQQLEAGEITQDTYQQLHNELESSLALDLSTESKAAEPVVTAKNKLMPVVLAVLIPVLAIGFYAEYGDFDAATGQREVTVIPAGKDHQKMSIDEAVAKLEQRLREQPENPDGWYMLAKTYMSMRNFEKAVWAYEKTIEQVGEDPEILLRYVDALAMTEGGSLTGTAKPFLDKVIVMVPDNPMVLWMAGTSERQQENYTRALTYWYKLRPAIQQDARSLAQLDELIQEAETHLNVDEVAMLKQAQPAPAADKPADIGAEIVVTVELDPTLRDKVSANDTLFIFAKALQGPPMPLAAVKQTAGALPLTVSLNDAMAMMPQMKLSNFEQVKISAVISKSGQPGAQAGDFYAEMSPVNTKNNETVKLFINQVK